MIWCPAVVLVGLVDRGGLAAKKENAGCFWALLLLLSRPWRSSDSKIGAKPTLLPCPVLLPFTDKSVCVGGTFSLYSVCGGTFWMYSHQFPFSDRLIHTPFAFYWLDIDNALVLICFQLNMYVCMCHKNVSWDCWVFLWFWCVFLWYWWVFLWFGVNKCKTQQCAPIDYVSLSPGLLLVRRSVGLGRNDLESAVKEINTLQTLSSSPWLQMRLFLKIIEILQIDAPRQ